MLGHGREPARRFPILTTGTPPTGTADLESRYSLRETSRTLLVPRVHLSVYLYVSRPYTRLLRAVYIYV